MRSATELQAKGLAEIPSILHRANMWAMTGNEMETLCRRLIEDLRFLDEHDPEVIRADQKRYGSVGVHGAFRDVLGDGKHIAEVASVYAEYFHRFGYLTVEKVVDWGPLAEAARTGLGDLRRDALEAAYGEPSLVVDSRIGCYVSAEGWLYVDYLDPEPSLVRDVRVPARTLQEGLLLTPSGQRVVGGGL